ncbi:Protein kti12 [Golovinomyces cichoracearum]|uniref:Protein kti12 n=1 Tax=Golovinomyces cichoracearum TaxID=62708 RepID=A0A420J204_9PEZI|nr:Protein kti12 [Golovinomyces cichoracearum]
MPLIILTGYPTSGKSHRAAQLQTYLTDRIRALPPTCPSSNLRVHLISDHKLHIPRSVYNLDTKETSERSNNSSEKDARATLYAAVTRVLSPKDIVIFDSGNYIKGWRYQLYCEAKAVRTTHCVVHIGTSIERARKINDERLATRQEENDEESMPYEKNCWENLVFRFEEPNVFARWDCPLFTVLWEDEQLPNEAIWEALVGSETSAKKVVRPNATTVAKIPKGEDYLHELDYMTQGVLSAILDWKRDHPGEVGGEINVGDNFVVSLPAESISLPLLQRLKRQYINLNRANAVSKNRIVECFVEYLNDAFGAV